MLGTIALLMGTALTMAEPAFAHHVMDGTLPDTFATGLLSGLGHPVIGLDHLAAVIAVGCLAATHRLAPLLAIGFVLAMMAGVSLHVYGTQLPGVEIVVALSVIVLGALMLTRRPLAADAALIVFAAVGFLHGYVLGESIYGAERAPLYAYLLGLAVIQCAIALGVIYVVRTAAQRTPEQLTVRFVGAGIAGIGLAIFVQQITPGA